MKHYSIIIKDSEAIIVDTNNSDPKINTTVLVWYKKSYDNYIPIIGKVTEEIPQGFPFRIEVDGNTYSINRYEGEVIKILSEKEFENFIQNA